MSRQADPAFDALALATGHTLPVTRSAGAAIGVKLAEILEVEPERSRQELAEEITLRAKRYRIRHPEWDLTPGALAKWWPTLGAPPEPEFFASEPVSDEPMVPPWVQEGLTWRQWNARQKVGADGSDGRQA